MNRAPTSRAIAAAAIAMLVIGVAPAHAARVGDVLETNAWEQAARFFSLRDPGLRLALLGSVLLGINCAVLGGFIVVRRMSLVGDTLSHAVLPGIALGFLWTMSKNPAAILTGALVVGGVAMLVVTWIKKTTLLKEDTALGLVLSSFFAVGAALMSMMQRLPTGAKSGLDKFMFGQAAAMSPADVIVLGALTLLVVLLVWRAYHGLLAMSFDGGFASGLGIPTGWLHHGLMLLTTAAIVTGMQAVGVVLVSAMLVIPAATAYLLTDRMHRLLFLAAAIGAAAAVLGAFFSFLGNNLPTGPFMVLAGAVFFVAAFLFAPRHGWVARGWRRVRQRRRTERENTLKSMHRILEDRGADFHAGIAPEDLARIRREPVNECQERLRALVRAGLAAPDPRGESWHFTPLGERRAKEIVRNHRLWELYLTNIAHYEADHVHDDAEKIEHVLGAEVVRQLERRLDYPETDPHGRKIPQPEDVLADARGPAADARSGYGGAAS